MAYVLEVVKFEDDKTKYGNDGYTKLIHLGYMNKRFRSKEEACNYYDNNNPHMRKLNTYDTYMSDWDPNTKLAYIVREDMLITLTIEPFKTFYVLEVVKFDDDETKYENEGYTKFIHIGYMNKRFKSKEEACEYYDSHNSHMRKLNEHKTYKSDWDPNTKLAYIVREDKLISLTVEPFN